VEKVILPALRAGKTVITDRFDSSTFAFQVYAERFPESESLFEECRKIVMHKCMPDAYIILDLPADVAQKRRSANPVKKEVFFDEKPLAYHKRARLGFKKFARGRRLLPSAPSALSCLRHAKVFFVDANRRPEEVHEDIMNIVHKQLVS
ncbi:MAG: dTMP kinase, partial [bacterium]|nr:dTMP kinase [bacterium]